MSIITIVIIIIIIIYILLYIFCFYMTNWIPLNSDIDECAEPGHGCSQLCNNTKGKLQLFLLKRLFLDERQQNLRW